jgi:predicted N-acyltransferase
MNSSTSTRIIDTTAKVAAADWNALQLDGNPFLRHEFLLALEEARCVNRDTGWRVQHLVVQDRAGHLQAAMPLYRKTHSWGEFVFDWSWARAYSQAGLEYYPKLVSMAPFTPVPGRRCLTLPSSDAAALRHTLTDALLEHARSQALSSAHVLFVLEEDRLTLQEQGFLLRKDCQFHWHNRGYHSFEDFITTFRADKRKKALRERRRILEAGVHFTTLRGDEISDELWSIVFGFSAGTFAAHGQEHYLNVDFFRAVARTLPNSVMVKLACIGDDRAIAAAIFFRSSDTLYGRYWGAAADFHSLHFETCYYQGIDYCIEQGLQHFEPGTQGEHKIARGFEPTATWSAHWIADPRFRHAIDQHLTREREGVDQYMVAVREHLPFRRE